MKAKLKAVQEYIKDLLTGDKKFIVFCHHKAMLTGVGKIDSFVTVKVASILSVPRSEKVLVFTRVVNPYYTT
jgi:hypothetical protein